MYGQWLGPDIDAFRDGSIGVMMLVADLADLVNVGGNGAVVNNEVESASSGFPTMSVVCVCTLIYRTEV